MTATGSANVARCQPDGVSFWKVTVPSELPVDVHSVPMCVPVLR